MQMYALPPPSDQIHNDISVVLLASHSEVSDKGRAAAGEAGEQFGVSGRCDPTLQDGVVTGPLLGETHRALREPSERIWPVQDANEHCQPAEKGIAMTNVGKLVEENRADIGHAVDSARDSADAIARHVDSIAHNLEATSRNMNEFSRRIREDPSLLLRGTDVAEGVEP